MQHTTNTIQPPYRLPACLEATDLLVEMVNAEDMVSVPFPVAMRAVDAALPALLDYAEAWDRRVAQAREEQARRRR